METGKVNQLSAMFLMPYNSGIQKTNLSQPLNTAKENSFKKELVLKTESKKAEKTTLISESDKINNSPKTVEQDRKKEHISEHNNETKEPKDKNIEKSSKKQAEQVKENKDKSGNKPDNKLDDKVVDNSKKAKIKQVHIKSPIKSHIKAIKEGIINNEITKKQIKEKVIDTRLHHSKKTSSKKSPEQLLFKETQTKNIEPHKTKINKIKEFKKVIDNRFKNHKKTNKKPEQPIKQTTDTQNDVESKEKIVIAKNEPVKTNIAPVNFHLNLEKEISVSEIKQDRTGNFKQLFEQYQEISNKILNKVDNVIKYMATKGTEAVSIRLQPPELGKIHIELTVKDNSIHAKIHTENIAVKEVILTNLDQLKSGIENNGFNINKLDVEVGGFKNFLPNESQQFGSKNKNNKPNNGGKLFGNGSNVAEVINRPLNPYIFTIGRSVNMLV